MTNRYLYLTLLAVLGFETDAWAGETVQSGAPRLVVSITIDQLRSDYLETFAPLYSDNGLKRLMGEGTVYMTASFPFTPVDRSSAVAALITGTTPYYNNIVGQQWLNRQTLRPVGSVDDVKCTGVGTEETASPVGLSTSTLGDELKVATTGRAIVYSIAPFRDSAVLSAGHAADGALWIDDANGEWCSSTYYCKKLPAWVRTFNSDYSPSQKLKESDERRYQKYKSSKLVNADVTTMAQQCIVSTSMGKDDVTDLLCLTYYVGSDRLWPKQDRQQDMQETYTRLDHEISQLIAYTEKWFGRDNVLFIVTGTGYCDEDDVDYKKYRIPTGTFNMTRTEGLLNIYFGAIWGQDKYVETTFGNQIFLNRKLLESKKISLSEATSRAQELLSMMSGVRNVYTLQQLLSSQSDHVRMVRNAFSNQRSGDLVIEVAPGWHVLNENTNDSQLSRTSVLQFPVIFYGAGVPAQRITQPVTVDRVAPTVARSIRIRAPNACSAEPLF
jgi:hypothetical protein